MTAVVTATSSPFVGYGARPWVMGILNVTPDSFSDGGLWGSTEAAVQHGHRLLSDGADLIDVGGESTRPGAHRVPTEKEIDRVVPVISALAADGVICSVDTTRATVAAAAIEAGAAIVNDVSGGLADPDMARVMADARVPWVLMHWRGHSDVMQDLAHYDDVVADVRTELLRQVDRAVAAGVDERSLVLDPGLGFAKSGDDNWVLLARLVEIVQIGLPVLVGASRKKFLGSLLADRAGVPRPPRDRDFATAITSVGAAEAGAWGVRVHAPRPTLDALAVREATAAAPRSVPEGGRVLDGIDRMAVLSDSPVVGDGRYRFGRVNKHG